jgi:hypothetical protein
MHTIFKGTTPTLFLTFDTDIDLSAADSVVVTFATDYKKTLFEKTGDDLTIDGQTISISFTQEETLAIKNPTMLIQMNALIGENRVCSDIASLRWTDNLKNEVMT